MTAPGAVGETCPGCGDDRQGASGPCSGCGTSAFAAQRRIVTVLFVDLSGYTALCAGRDPEEVHLLVRPLMNGLRHRCQALGGVVPAIEGDGFMASFGALQASADDPDRAVAAARAMQELVLSRQHVFGRDLPSLRCGIHVGEVLVAPSWETSGFSLSGDVVNVASRLCDAAPPGGILVSQDLVALCEVTRDWGAARGVDLRGRAEPVLVRELTSGTTSARVEQDPHRTPYVPRPSLETALTAMTAIGPVVVTGEAGVGKSRLAVEWAHRQVGPPATLLVRSGAFGRVSLGDLLDGLDTVLGNGPEDATEPEQVARAVHLLAQQEHPVVLVLEDLPWLTPAAKALVDQLAILAPGLLRVVGLTRSVTTVDWPVLEVTPLDADNIARMVQSLLPGASEELTRVLQERSGGNPLFLEQCVHLLVANGAVVRDPLGARLLRPDLLRQVPTSMRLFVTGRLDQLTVQERRVLSIAAVLGDEPDIDLLSHLTGGASSEVEALVGKGLLTWTRTGNPGHPSLRFAHALVRDVAYDGQLRRSRVEVHRAAAEWYAALPVAAVLASRALHLEASVALGESDCDLVREAFEAMVLHARSIQDERPRDAADVLSRAEVLADSRAECRLDRLHLDLALTCVLELGGERERAEEVGQRTLSAARSRGAKDVVAEAALRVGRTLLLRDPAQARPLLEEAEASFLAVEDHVGVARVAVERAVLVELTEGFGPYLAALEVAYDRALRAGDVRTQSSAAQQLAIHSSVIDRDSVALWSHRARSSARRDDAALEARLLLAEAVVEFYAYDVAKAARLAAAAAQLGQDSAIAHVAVNARLIETEALLGQGDRLRARASLDVAKQLLGSEPSRLMSVLTKVLEARLAARDGAMEQAWRWWQAAAQEEAAQGSALRRDLDEAQAALLLDTGHFAAAAEAAARASAEDDALAQPLGGLRARLLRVVAALASGRHIPLADLSSLRSQARACGAGPLEGVLARWLALDELLHGHRVELSDLDPVPGVEAAALDLLLDGLSRGEPRLLLRSAERWAQLGPSVWQAQALLWHSELTGVAAPEASALLHDLGSPPGLEQVLRHQVRRTVR